MTMAKRNGLHAVHYEVQNAFSNGKLDRTVYMEFPKFIYRDDQRKSQVMKLKRSSYVLKDAARIWHDLLSFMFEEAVLKDFK